MIAIKIIIGEDIIKLLIHIFLKLIKNILKNKFWKEMVNAQELNDIFEVNKMDIYVLIGWAM